MCPLGLIRPRRGPTPRRAGPRTCCQTSRQGLGRTRSRYTGSLGTRGAGVRCTVPAAGPSSAGVSPTGTGAPAPASVEASVVVASSIGAVWVSAGPGPVSAGPGPVSAGPGTQGATGTSGDPVARPPPAAAAASAARLLSCRVSPRQLQAAPSPDPLRSQMVRQARRWPDCRQEAPPGPRWPDRRQAAPPAPRPPPVRAQARPREKLDPARSDPGRCRARRVVGRSPGVWTQSARAADAAEEAGTPGVGEAARPEVAGVEAGL